MMLVRLETVMQHVEEARTLEQFGLNSAAVSLLSMMIITWSLHCHFFTYIGCMLVKTEFIVYSSLNVIVTSSEIGPTHIGCHCF